MYGYGWLGERRHQTFLTWSLTRKSFILPHNQEVLHMKKQQINIIDLFAGPGGLGEGFQLIHGR